MTTQPTPPLDADERDLARRLARLDAGAAPSRALDARVLAHAAGGQAVSPAAAAGGGRPHRRWAVGMGLAASVVLAAGLALQLRPPGAATDGYVEPPAAGAVEIQATGSTPAVADTEAAGAVEAPSRTRESQAAAPDRVGEPGASRPASERVVRQRATDATVPSTEDAAGQPRAARTPAGNTLADAPTPMPPPDAPPATAAPAPPAPAASTPALRAATAPAVPAPQGKAAARADAASEADLPPPGRQDGSRAIPATAPDEEPFDEAPPASADSPAVRRAWLERIHELVAAGERDAAVASLQEFRRRYPAAVIPEDLRDLLP